MARFQKGQPRPKNAGRKKGTPNKSTSLRLALDSANFNFITKLLAALDTQPPYQQVDTLVHMLPYLYSKISTEDSQSAGVFFFRKRNGEVEEFGVNRTDE